MKNRHNLKLKNTMIRILKVAVVGGIVFPFFFTAAAQAHDTLVKTTPEAEQNLQSAPPSVQLRFSSTPLAQGTTVVVMDSQQKNWATGAPEITPNTVTQRLKPGAPAGRYQVRGNIVSSDGHVINPSYNFSIGGAGQAVVPLTPNADSSASTTATQTTEASPSPSSSDSSAPAVVDNVKKAADSFPWWIIWTLLPIFIASLVALLIWNRIKSKRRVSQQENVAKNTPGDDSQRRNC